MNSSFRRTLPVALLALAMLPQIAPAQSILPILTLQDAEVFEGNNGTTDLIFNVTLDRASATPVTGNMTFSPVTTVGPGMGQATGGSAFGFPSVDYIQVNNAPFSIPAGATSTTFTVAVRGDVAVEPIELFALTATSIVGARALLGSNSAVGTILNDDGPPAISIADISVSEPFGKLKTRNVNFTVSLSHPKPGDGTLAGTTVNFATVAGTATSGSGSISNPVPPDFGGRLGTLTIPQGDTSGQISVPIFGDDLVEPDETFRVVLSNAAGGTIADGDATCTIRDFTLSTGAFDFAPDNALVPADETHLFTVVWTVPEGGLWRDLRMIDFRLRIGNATAFWIRWDEGSDTFSLAQTRGKNHDRRRKGHHHDDECDDAVTFGPGQAPGSDGVLATRYAALDLAQTAVTGSGPDGLTVTLQLALSFPSKNGGHAFRVDVAASDDLGHADPFTKAGTVYVQCERRK